MNNRDEYDRAIPVDRYRPNFTEGFVCSFNGDIDDLGPECDYDGFHNNTTLGEEESFLVEYELPYIKRRSVHHKRKIDPRVF